MTEQTQPTDAELIAFATEDQFLLFCDPDEFTDIARAVLAKWGTPAGAGEPVAKLWLWKNFVGGKPEYWAFDNPFPCVSAGGDPLTLGEPCGWALLKPSVNGRPQRSEQEVTNTVYRLHATPQPTQAQAGAVPLTFEQARAIREGELNASSEGYFGARSKLDTNRNHNLFKAGFERGWDAREDLYAKE